MLIYRWQTGGCGDVYSANRRPLGCVEGRKEAVVMHRQQTGGYGDV